MTPVAVTKLSVSLAADLADAVRVDAARTGTSVSSWVADAAAARLRTNALTAFLDDWQAEHGAFTADEIAAAESRLGYRPAQAV